ncbi:MAG: GerMN domain-containing protein [Actinomycetes bacterium]
MTAALPRKGLLLVVLALTGCGVPTGTVATIPSTEVPYGLLAPAPSDQATSPAEGQQMTSPRLFLVDQEDRLVPVPTMVDAGSTASVVSQVLDQLDDGPTERDRNEGLSSALGPGASLSLLQVRRTTALVELSVPTREPVPGRLPLAVGQVVLSLTSVEGIDAVQFRQDGHAVEVALPGGARTSAAVTAADYAALVAPGSATTAKVEPSPMTPGG